LTIGLVVGARGELSRSVKQFVSDCAEKGSINPERFGCCQGQDQARDMIASFINRAFGWVSLRSLGSGSRLSNSCHGLEAVRCGPLDLDGYEGERERVGIDRRPG